MTTAIINPAFNSIHFNAEPLKIAEAKLLVIKKISLFAAILACVATAILM